MRFAAASRWKIKSDPVEKLKQIEKVFCQIISIMPLGTHWQHLGIWFVISMPWRRGEAPAVVALLTSFRRSSLPLLSNCWQDSMKCLPHFSYPVSYQRLPWKLVCPSRCAITRLPLGITGYFSYICSVRGLSFLTCELIEWFKVWNIF